MKHTRYKNIQPYITKDNSQIRELMHPDHHQCNNLSLAEAIVAANSSTVLHQHKNTEELYHITQGSGIMTLGDEKFSVGIGDTVSIAPNTPHKIYNNGVIPLKVLCCCAPAYSHRDTELLE